MVGRDSYGIHFTDEKTEVWRGLVLCPQLHSQEVYEVEFFLHFFLLSHQYIENMLVSIIFSRYRKLIHSFF